MKVWIQRVTEASVTVENEKIAEIGLGYLILLGVAPADCEKDADELSGSDIFADYFEAPEDSDLTGWTVLGADGAPIGPIVGYEDIPGNPCVYVDTQSGERLIPLHPDLVQDMDPDARTVTLQIPEGLL